MAEGAPSSSSSSRPPLHHPPVANINSSAIVPLSSSPLTYIVQVQKDNIYRVPPPENARLTEQYRAKHSSMRRAQAPCLRFLLHVLCIVITISIPLLIASLIFYIIVRPKIPTFYIDHIVVKPYFKTMYDIQMEVTNPSLKMGYLIQKGGGGAATLTYHGKRVAEGELPQFYLNAKETKTFKMTLSGMKKDGLKAMEESLKGSRRLMQLQLTLEMPMRVGLGSIRLWAMKMMVECDVNANIVGKALRVSSQKCEVHVSS